MSAVSFLHLGRAEQRDQALCLTNFPSFRTSLGKGVCTVLVELVISLRTRLTLACFSAP